MKQIAAYMKLLLVLLPLVAVAQTETIDGVEWDYNVEDGEAMIMSVPSAANVVIPSTIAGCPVTRIRHQVFRMKQNLKSVTIPASVTNIGSGFYQCGVQTFNVDEANPKYSSRCGMLCSKDGSILIAGGNRDEVVIPPSVKIIGISAFHGCNRLTSVTIPPGVTNIKEHAFSGCKNLASVTIPSNVRSIGYGAFSGTKFIRDWPEGLIILGGGVLYSCRGKGQSFVTIPSNATSIVKGAFTGCKGLTTVNIPSSVLYIESGAFDFRSYWIGGTSLRYVPADCGVMSFSVAEDNPSYSSKKGLLCSKDGSILVVGVGGDVDIPSCVTNIAYLAFSGCSRLKSITIPSSVTSIGSLAFVGCKELSAMTISSTVTNIDQWAFEDCPMLKTVNVVRDGKIEVVSYDDFCKRLKLEHRQPERRSSASRRPAAQATTGQAVGRSPGVGLGTLQERRRHVQRQRARAAAAKAKAEAEAKAKAGQRETEPKERNKK